MRSTLVALGGAALLGLAASQVTDTFVLSQCECPGSEFSSLEKLFFRSPFKLATNAEDVLHCFGDDDFPVAPGFIAFFTEDADSTGLSANASRDFFFDEFSRRSEWYVAIRMVLNVSDGANITLLDMNSGDQNFLNVDLSTASKSADDIEWILRIASEIAPVDFTMRSSFRTETTSFDIIIGEGTVNDEFGVFGKILVGGRGDSFAITQLLVRDDFLPVAAEVLSVNLFSGSTDGDPFPLLVNGFQFGRGRFPGFPDSGSADLDDVFEALDFAPVAALPSVTEPQLQKLLSAVEGESLEVDVTSFLEGGDIALEELEILIDKGQLDGTFASNSPGNPFTYTPSKDFVGNQNFSFSYGVNQPYSCFNRNVPVTIVVAEGSNSSVGTILLSIFITALVVGGMIGAAIVYRKKRAAKEDLAKKDDSEEDLAKKDDAEEVTV